MKWAIALTTLLSAVNLSPAGSWGTSCTGPVGSVVPVEYLWIKSSPGEYALFLGRVQVGSLRLEDRQFFFLSGDTWLAGQSPARFPENVCRCPDGCSCPLDDCRCDPANCPCREAKKKEKPMRSTVLTGVDAGKVASSKKQHTVNGKAVSRQELLEALGKPAIPADQDSLRLTLIGSKNATDGILSDLNTVPKLAEAVKGLSIRQYTPDEWQVQDCGLTAGRGLSIVLQTPEGRVLHRQNDYDGPISLATALRDARADYDANKDPDRRKPSFSLDNVLSRIDKVPPEYWVIGVLFALLVFLPHK